jgi:putative transcriptional regulator
MNSGGKGKTELRGKARLRAEIVETFAGYLNVAVSTVSQWERGQRRPTGTALKLLHVVKSKGLEVLR